MKEYILTEEQLTELLEYTLEYNIMVMYNCHNLPGYEDYKNDYLSEIAEKIHKHNQKVDDFTIKDYAHYYLKNYKLKE